MNHTDAGFEALRSGHLAAARTKLQTAVDTHANNARAWKGLALCCRQLEDWKSALEALSGVINSSAAASEVHAAYHLKAQLLDGQLNQLRKAKEHYERALQFNDTDVFAYLALAEMALRQRRWQLAVAQADRGLQFSVPDDKQRAWLMFMRAVGQRRSTLSVGPVSSFFNQLGASKGDDALAQALESWPGLAQLVPEDPLAHPEQAAAAAQKHLLRPTLPSWWRA